MSVLSLKLKEVSFPVGSYKAIVSRSILCDLEDNLELNPETIDVDGCNEDTKYVRWIKGDQEVNPNTVPATDKIALEDLVDKTSGWQLSDESKAAFISSINELDDAVEVCNESFLESQFSGE